MRHRSFVDAKLSIGRKRMISSVRPVNASASGSHQIDHRYPLEQHLLRTGQRHKAVAQWLENRIRNRLQLLGEIVFVVNA